MKIITDSKTYEFVEVEALNLTLFGLTTRASKLEERGVSRQEKEGIVKKR